MSEDLTRLVEAMLEKMETLERLYTVVDRNVKFKFGQCLETGCYECDLHPECEAIHKFLSHLNEMAVFHLTSLASLLRKRLEELRSDAEEKEEG